VGVEILETLRGLGIKVEVVGPDRLRCELASKIPAALVPRIREAKAEIIEALRVRSAVCMIRPGSSPVCYELEPSRQVQHPWEGCISTAGEKTKLHQVGRACWHCSGAGSCGCIVCDAGGRLEIEAGPCTVCKGSGCISGADSMIELTELVKRACPALRSRAGTG
jgi:hypothetical protein